MHKIKTELTLPDRIELKENGERRAVLEISPFEAGFGVTFAHPIRRTLLASSVGYAPVAIKIDGVKHEFDSVRGMLEDVANLIINLKSIRFKFKEPSKREIIVSYSFKGPQTITGASLINSEVDVVNPEEYVATLNEEAELELSILIKKGMGYVPVEEFREDLPDGFIGIDAYFSPVKRVQYHIEKFLREDDPTFEKVIFEIEGDGQRVPLDLFKEAVDNFLKHFVGVSRKFGLQVIEAGVVELGPEYNILFEPIERMNLRSRSYNSLDRAGIKFIGELVLKGREEIANIKNLGQKSLEEIIEKLEEIGFPVTKVLPAEIRTTIEEKIKQLKGESNEA